MGLGRTLAALVLLAAGCRQPRAASVAWTHWFSFRSVEDLAIAPDGDVVLVGEDTLDVVGDSSGAWPRRPWLMRVDAAGDTRAAWTGFAGRPRALAVDEASVYLVLSGVRDPTDPDDPALGRCRIVAMDANGAARWSVAWDRTDGQSRCPDAIAIADGSIVARSGPALVGISAGDGSQIWEQSTPGWFERHPMVVRGSEIWLLGGRATDDDEATTVALRVAAVDGRLTDVALTEPRWDTSGFVVDSRRIVLLETSADPSHPETRLSAFDHDGGALWVESIASADEPAIAYQSVVSLEDAYWLAGTEQVTSAGGISQATAHRIRLQRHSADGELEATLLREFAEDGRDAQDRSACATSDVVYPPIVGSSITRLAVDHEGRLIVIGRQGCRDAFALALEVPR